jgi:hypothetical protein
MIPRAAVTEWVNKAPWKDMHNVEQDLIIGRALTAIFNDGILSTYTLDELIGTKIRALYQRKKGRDFFDLYYTVESGKQNYEHDCDGDVKGYSNRLNSPIYQPCRTFCFFNFFTGE